MPDKAPSDNQDSPVRREFTLDYAETRVVLDWLACAARDPELPARAGEDYAGENSGSFGPDLTLPEEWRPLYERLLEFMEESDAR